MLESHIATHAAVTERVDHGEVVTVAGATARLEDDMPHSAELEFVYEAFDAASSTSL